MASLPTQQCFFLALLFIACFFCNLGAAQDPTTTVARALTCFDDQIIYSSCDVAFRLTTAGILNVDRDETEQYCDGPCLAETQLVLNCLDGNLSDFLFYNRATVRDVRSTLFDACGNTRKRGDFNVAKHILSERSHAEKLANPKYASFGYGLILVSQLALLM